MSAGARPGPGTAGTKEHRIAAAAIFLLAAALRAPLLTQGLPYIAYVDEGHVLHPVIQMLRTGGWDPGWYLHPSLTIEAVTLGAHLLRPVYRMARGRSLLEDLPHDETFYDALSPPELILVGRCVVLAASLGLVMAAMALATRMGGSRAGLAAGLLVAICPALVQRSPIVIVDTVSTLLVTAALLGSRRLEEALADSGPASGVARREALLAGALSGVAATAKYPAALVFAAVLVAIVLGGGKIRERIRLAFIAAVAALAAAALTMPALVLRARRVVWALREQSRLYADPSSFHSPPGLGLLRQALRTEELGPALAVAGLAAVLALAIRKSTRTTALSWLPFGALLLAPLLAHEYQPFRNALPLVPILLIAIAVLLFRESIRPKWRAAAALLFLALAGSLVPGVRDAIRMRTVTDTRVQAVDILESDGFAGKRLLVERELAILPSELKRVKAAVTVVAWTELRALAESGNHDLALVGVFDPAGAPDSRTVAEYADWNRWVSSLPADVALGARPTPVFPNFWRYPDQILRLTPVGNRPDRGVPSDGPGISSVKASSQRVACVASVRLR